jgi:CheY-like chemotaxis protein/anti-sigma regulatory factor (Ser/Thr protein kinase)
MSSILVVDDDAVDRELVGRCLKPVQELQVRYAHDGTEALAALEQGSPDVVLTDLRMPGMDGLELVERLQAERPQVPVILMTSQGNERIAVRALRAGASSYVPKSELKAELADTVSRALQIAEARRLHGALVGHLERSEVHFELANDPALVYPLAVYLQDNLARLGFGDPTVRSQIGIAISEAVTNAMIHGNLEVGSELRRSNHLNFRQMVEKRRTQHPFMDRKVHCTARETRDAVEYTIADEGPGFDPTSLPDPTAPENLLNTSGRGVMLMRTFMDFVRFNERGNQITMVKNAG